MPTIRQTTRQAIINYCLNATDDQVLGGKHEGNTVVRLNNNTAVKWGCGVLKQEYLNQLEAQRLLNPNIVRVPKPYDFFRDDLGRGYLVMELVLGVKKRKIEDEHDVAALSQALQHFASIKTSCPGPLARQGPSYALLFGESDHPTFASTLDLERWFNRRLFVDKSLVFTTSEICFCHMDLFPRNILWEKGQPLCVLDWLTAGFWPSIFERCAHLIVEDDESIPSGAWLPLSATEHTQIELIMRAWKNIQRYTFDARHSHPDLSDLGIVYEPEPVPSSPLDDVDWDPSHNATVTAAIG